MPPQSGLLKTYRVLQKQNCRNSHCCISCRSIEIYGFINTKRLAATSVRAKAELFLGWRFSARPKKREPETDPKGHAQIENVYRFIIRFCRLLLIANSMIFITLTPSCAVTGSGLFWLIAAASWSKNAI